MFWGFCFALVLGRLPSVSVPEPDHAGSWEDLDAPPAKSGTRR